MHTERGGHVFIHKDERALAEIAEFLATFASPATPETNDPQFDPTAIWGTRAMRFVRTLKGNVPREV